MKESFMTLKSLAPILLTLALVALLLARSVSAGVIPLGSPASFSAGATTIDFDDVAASALANTRYAGEGVTFSRDDGEGVVIFDWDALGRTTASSPNVLGTISDLALGANGFVTHLNVNFSSTVFEVGAFFGNDQGFDGYTQTTLTLFDAADAVLGSLVLATNDNTSVDQFLGLRSDVPIARARFNNNGTDLSVVIDDLVFGGAAAAATPGTLFLLVGGLAALAGVRRRTMHRVPIN